MLFWDEVLEADEDWDWDIFRAEVAYFLNNILIELFHDESLQIFSSHHQVSQGEKAFDAEVVAANPSQFRQNRQDDFSELKVVVHKELAMLHESFYVLLDCVRVFGLGKWLDENALVLSLLELFYLFCVVIELLEEL